MRLSIGASPNDIAIVDSDRDGKLDIVAANTSNASILINTTPIVTLGSALNGASFATTQPLAPGSLSSLFGSGFVTQNAQASTIPLPVSLRGVSMTVGGVPAPLLFVSAKQINFQVPWTVPAINADGSLTAPEGSLPGLATHPAKRSSCWRRAWVR